MPALILWLVRQTGLSLVAVRRGLAIFGILLAFGAAIGGWKLWLSHHDSQLIETHETKVAASAATATLNAERSANAADAAAAANDQAAAAIVQEDIRNATNAHPQEAARPVGPASSAVLDRLRHR
jgi:hypothetical protein